MIFLDKKNNVYNNIIGDCEVENMDIKEVIKKFKGKYNQNDLGKLAEKGAEKVQATLEEYKEEANIDEVQIATDTAMEEMKKIPKRQLAVEMIGNINENVSPEVAVNAVIQLTEADEFSEKTAVEVATKTDFSDEHIITIIEEGSIGYEGKTAIAETLKDEKIREEIQQQIDKEEEKQCLQKLNKIYLLCDEDINELKLKKHLDEVMKDVHIDTNDIQEIKNKIIAKLIALNFARYGSNIVSKQTSLMSALEMRNNNIVRIAEAEYRKIEHENEAIKGRQLKKFNEHDLMDSISAEIEAAAKTDTFDEKTAIKKMTDSMYTFLRYDERKELLTAIQKEIENEKIRKTNKKIRESKVIEQLAELPESELNDVIKTLEKTLGKTLEKRKNNLNKEKTNTKERDEER